MDCDEPLKRGDHDPTRFVDFHSVELALANQVVDLGSAEIESVGGAGDRNNQSAVEGVVETSVRNSGGHGDFSEFWFVGSNRPAARSAWRPKSRLVQSGPGSL